MFTREISLTTFDRIKNFARAVCSFESDIDIYKDNPNEAYDAKSLLGILAIDLSSPVHISINTDNADELTKFNKEMDNFI